MNGEQMATANTETILFRVSEDELTFLLEGVGASRLPGMADLPYGTDDADEMARQRLNAHHALMARGLMGLSSEKLIFDSTISQIISLCVFPRHLVVIAARDSAEQRPSIATYYVSPPVTVLHTQAVIGVHEFKVLSQPVDFQTALEQRLPVLSGIERQGKICLERDVLTDIMKSPQETDREMLTQKLQDAGYALADVAPFVDSLLMPHIRCVVQVAKLTDGRAASKTLSLMYETPRCWILDGIDTKDAEQLVEIRMLTQAELSRIMGELFQPLLQ